MKEVAFLLLIQALLLPDSFRGVADAEVGGKDREGGEGPLSPSSVLYYLSQHEVGWYNTERGGNLANNSGCVCAHATYQKETAKMNLGIQTPATLVSL